MSTTLYVSDLDGTLLGADSRVSRRSAEIITDLTDRGVMITAATARTPATVDGLLRGTGLRLPVIVMTGAAMWHPVKRCFEMQHFIDGDTVEIIRLTMGRHGLSPFVYTIDAAGIIHTRHYGPVSKRDREFAAERSHLPLKRLYMIDAQWSAVEPRTILVLAMGPVAQVMTCADALRATGECGVSAYTDIFHPETALLEVLAKGVSKASAIRALADQLGADRVTAFGDNLNDIPMLQAADHAVAVGNAMDQVKAVADEVIGTNTADSVARYILEREG